MKPKLILTGHGFFSEQLLESAKMIVGEIDDAFSVVTTMDDGLERTRAKMQRVLDEIGFDVPVLIMVDIIAGMPANVSIEIMSKRRNVRLLAGMNLPMVLEYVFAEGELDELTQYLRKVGSEAVQIVNMSETEVCEEGYVD